MPFHSIIKTLKLERERNFQPGKKSSVKILTSTTLNDEKQKFPAKIRYKTRISAFITSFQLFTRGSN